MLNTGVFALHIFCIVNVAPLQPLVEAVADSCRSRASPELIKHVHLWSLKTIPIVCLYLKCISLADSRTLSNRLMILAHGRYCNITNAGLITKQDITKLIS